MMAKPKSHRQQSGLKRARATPDRASQCVCTPNDGASARSASRESPINAIAAPGDLDALALKAAQDIAKIAPEAVMDSRRLIRGERDEVIASIDTEAAQFCERLRSSEMKAAFKAFFKTKEK